MNVPLIGQSQKQPIINVDVAAKDGHVALTLTLLGVDHRTAMMNHEVAANVMGQIGMALEEVRPGTLIQGLKNWIAELESMKANGKKALREMGIK